MAKRKLLQTLVVVCEGEKTEPCYIKEIIEYARNKGGFNYDDYKILPSIENGQPIQHKSTGRTKRSFKENEDGVYSYIEHTEADLETYDKYKAYPLCFVREAALFLEDETYTNAWVLFDKDGHPAHEKAFKYATETGVSIAFSSRSIEEWFLCHFERNSQSFDKTICDMCEDEASKGCSGSSCLIGRLRSNFIADYEKNKDDIFNTHTISNIRKAFINASWTRFYSKSKFYSDNIWEYNPYTDVDKMIQNLFTTDLLDALEINGLFEWFELNKVVSNIFRLSIQSSNIYQIENCSDRLIVLNAYCLKDDLSDKQYIGDFKIEKGHCQNINISDNHPIFEIHYGNKYFFHKI